MRMDRESDTRKASKEEPPSIMFAYPGAAVTIKVNLGSEYRFLDIALALC